MNQKENTTEGADGSPVIQVSAKALLTILFVLLASAIALLLLAHTKEQYIAAYILFALVVAVVTFGFLGASGMVRTKDKQIGGSLAGFVIVLGMLLPFVKESTVDIRGTIYVDEVPPKKATIFLLETELRENRRILEERDQGQFEFRDVRGVDKDQIRFNIELEGYKPYTFKAAYMEFIRIEISKAKLIPIIPPKENPCNEVEPGRSQTEQNSGSRELTPDDQRERNSEAVNPANGAPPQSTSGNETTTDTTQAQENTTSDESIQDTQSADITGNGEQPAKPIVLRSHPNTLHNAGILQMIEKKSFNLPGTSPPVKGQFQHNYEPKTLQGQQVIIDHKTCLVWQQSGSDGFLPSDKTGVEAYIRQLQKDRYADFSEWRLPTVEELASLLEFTQKKRGRYFNLYIDSEFDEKQHTCWSNDQQADNRSHFPVWWVVNFKDGTVHDSNQALSNIYVRAVCPVK